MRFAALFVTVGIAAAATTTTAAADSASTDTGCLAQNILDTCLASTGAILVDCKPNDWKCMCDSQNAVLTCYNNCPNDPGKSPASNQQIQWCGAAAAASSASALTATGTSATSTIASQSASSTSSGSFSTGTGSSATKPNGASGMIAPAGGLIAMAFGLAGIL